MTLSDRLPPRGRAALQFARHHSNTLLFIAGFLFDFLTMVRIDSWTDLAIQVAYLSALTTLLLYQYREHRGFWTPSPRVARWWRFNVDALHFFYGGLLSAYVVLYFKSRTGARPLIFFVVLVALMFVNEIPQVRRVGYRLRLGLYAFCVLSFLNYFLPILIGRMGAWIFFLSVLLAGWIVWRVAQKLASHEQNPKAAQVRLFAPAAFVMVIIVTLYVFRLIPPVPLSVQYQGIFHDVQRSNGNFTLVYEKPPFYAFWRRDSRPFRQREGDRVFYFARIFAPSRFRHQVTIRWDLQDPNRKTWAVADRIPLSLLGGRAEGFRGVVSKTNFTPGKWRVAIETEDGRTFGTLSFRVDQDQSQKDRRWKSIRA